MRRLTQFAAPSVLCLGQCRGAAATGPPVVSTDSLLPNASKSYQQLAREHARADHVTVQGKSYSPAEYRKWRAKYEYDDGFHKAWSQPTLGNWALYVIGGFTFYFWLNEIYFSPVGEMPIPDEAFTEYEKEQRKRAKDPNRIAWPMVHSRVTKIREGKMPHDELNKLWEQTKYYYPGDWLVPVEIVQILKYTTPKFVAQYVPNPEEMRKELLVQLLNVKYGRVATIDRMTKDTREIIDLACEDLSRMDFTDPTAIPLVPTHT